MASAIDLNADLGEGFGPYCIGADEELLALVSSASVACGFHAGDPRVMERTVALAAERGVAIGAHVSYPDRVGFGRRRIDATPDEIRTDVLYQLGALEAFCRARRVRLEHVKPHGALYNVAAVEPVVAEAIVAAILAFDRELILLAPPGSELARAGERAGLLVACEGFPDRALNPDGTLVSRHDPRAIVRDPEAVAARAARMAAEGRVAAVNGHDVAVRVHTLCIHGDNPEAPRVAAAVRRHLAAAGVAVRPLRAVLGGAEGARGPGDAAPGRGPRP